MGLGEEMMYGQDVSEILEEQAPFWILYYLLIAVGPTLYLILTT